MSTRNEQRVGEGGNESHSLRSYIDPEALLSKAARNESC